MQRVSTNFTLQEVEHSDIALRLGIENKAPQEVIERAELVAHHVLEPCRDHWGRGFIPSSWYRCEAVERILTWDGGFRQWCAKRSFLWGEASWPAYFARKQHPTGASVDFEIPGVDNDDLYFWIRDNLEYDQLIREFPKPSIPSSGWVHGSWTVDARRKQAFSIPWYDKYA